MIVPCAHFWALRPSGSLTGGYLAIVASLRFLFAFAGDGQPDAS